MDTVSSNHQPKEIPVATKAKEKPPTQRKGEALGRSEMTTDDPTPPAIPRRLTCRQKVTHWGQPYTIKPAVVKQNFGDGRVVLWVQPLDTRPDYYLVRIDSKWATGDIDGDEFSDFIEQDVIEAISDEYGERELEREYLEEDLREQGIEPTGENTDLDGNEDRLGWPVLCLDCGCAWGIEHVIKPRTRKAVSK